VLCDEVDRYPPSAGAEGDPVTLARKRATTFWNRKVVLTSTPTVKGYSRIEAAFEASDQRHYHVPCPHCDEPQVLKWAAVSWPNGEPEKAAYHCIVCGAEWTDTQRWAAIRRGEWRADAPFKGTAGFHLNELYSTWVRIGEIAANFVEAKKSPETLKAWVNTSLGETWEIEGERIDETGLMERREDWGADLPAGVMLLTAGVDAQDDRLEVEVVGWGRDEESWSLEHIRIFGDPSAPALWSDLDRKLTQTFTRVDGVSLPISAVCVDSGGHHTHAVYRYCKERFRRRVFAIKGMGGAGRPLWPKKASKNNAGKVNLFLIGVDAGKEAIYSRLRIERKGPGFCHFPIDRDAEWFAQMTAETVTTKYSRGFPSRVWVKRPGARNEALDCRVYAYAALQSLNVVWSRFKDVVARKPTEPVPEPTNNLPKAVLASTAPRRRRLLHPGI
jgi:phage terminase large subunit GpA-like protein